jgi:hypothetical protein
VNSRFLSRNPKPAAAAICALALLPRSNGSKAGRRALVSVIVGDSWQIAVRERRVSVDNCREISQPGAARLPASHNWVECGVRQFDDGAMLIGHIIYVSF